MSQDSTDLEGFKKQLLKKESITTHAMYKYLNVTANGDFTPATLYSKCLVQDAY